MVGLRLEGNPGGQIFPFDSGYLSLMHMFGGTPKLMTPIFGSRNLETSIYHISRLRLFGHIARAGPSQDHTRALRAAISRLPVDWHRPPGRPRRTWLRTIELDPQQHNLGLNSAWKRAQDRSKWRKLVETAISCQGRASRWWWWWWWSHSMKIILIFWTVQVQLISMTDGRTDGQTAFSTSAI